MADLAILVVNLFATSGFPELYAVNILEDQSCRYGTVRNDSAGRTGFVGISPRTEERSILPALRQQPSSSTKPPSLSVGSVYSRIKKVQRRERRYPDQKCPVIGED